MRLNLSKECLHYLKKENSKNIFHLLIGIWFRQNILHKFELPYLEMFITTKCNLKCLKCSNLIPYCDDNKNYEVFDIKRDLELLLSKIDCLYRLKIHGGEVFLHPQLREIISFVNNYSKIKSIRMTTNGTIIPSDNILKEIAKGKIVVQISDYDLPNTKIDQLIKKFQSFGVKYVYLKNQIWYDMGECEKRKNNQFAECSIKRCTSLFEGKVYVCSRGAIMTKKGIISDEGIPLTLEKTKLKKECKKLFKGKYSIACKYCNGDTRISNIVKAGEQIR